MQLCDRKTHCEKNNLHTCLVQLDELYSALYVEILNIMPMFYLHVGVVGYVCKSEHFCFPSIKLLDLKFKAYSLIKVFS
jgi:hypothetical protein